MSFTSVTITGTIENTATTPVANATITFQLSAPITDGVTLIEPTLLTTTTNSSGQFSLAVLANDDSTTTPRGTSYTVTITAGSWTDSWSVIVPHSAAPSIDLFALAVLSPPSTPAQPYVATLEGLNGAVTLASPNSSLTIATSGQTINLEAANSTTISQQSGNYTFALTDAGTEVDYTGTAAATFTIPANSSVSFPVGTRIRCRQTNTGVLTLSPASGVTLYNGSTTSGSVTLSEELYVVEIVQNATNVWATSWPISALPTPTASGQIIVSTGAGQGDWSLVQAATKYTNTPTPDTTAGSAGTSGQWADGAHSHAQSGLYDGFGVDSLNVVSSTGGTLTLAAPTSHQADFVLATSNVVISLPAPIAGGRKKVYIKQDATGSRAWTLPADGVYYPASVPSPSTTPGYVDMLEFVCFDGYYWCLDRYQFGIQPPIIPMNLFVQSTSVKFIGGSGTQTVTLNFPNNITPGNAILLLCANGPSLSGVNGTGGITTFNTLVSSSPTFIALGLDSAGGTSSVQASMTGTNGGNTYIYAYEVAGTAGTDGSGNYTTTGSNQTSSIVAPSLTPSMSGDAYVGLLVTGGGDAASSISITQNFTLEFLNEFGNEGDVMLSIYLFYNTGVASGTTYNPTLSISSGIMNWSTAAVLLKP